MLPIVRSISFLFLSSFSFLLPPFSLTFPILAHFLRPQDAAFIVIILAFFSPGNTPCRCSNKMENHKVQEKMRRGRKLQGVLRARCHTAPFDGEKLVSCSLILEQAGESSLSLPLTFNFHSFQRVMNILFLALPVLLLILVYIYTIFLSSILTNSGRDSGINS